MAKAFEAGAPVVVDLEGERTAGVVIRHAPDNPTTLISLNRPRKLPGFAKPQTRAWVRLAA